MALDVLIVDDSAAIRKILQRVLKNTDLSLGTIHEASDGKEAMATLAGNDVQLILSDINMPNMDGLELLAAVRQDSKHSKVPVVMISTEGGQEKVMKALELGASGYIRKPFTPDQIKEKLVGIV